MLAISFFFVIIASIMTYRLDDKHYFNYFKFSKEGFTYGETFSNRYGVQVRSVGIQYQVIP
jgi:hypothetical protein